MLYGAVAASELRFVPISSARFAGAGNLIVSGYLTNSIQTGAGNFAGIGNLIASGYLSNPLILATAAFTGAGQMTAYLSLPEDSATTAWAAAVVTAGGTVSGPRKSLVNDLIIGLKADGLWTKLDRLWILAAENSQSALIDLVSTASASITGSPVPTFTTDRGYTGAGAGGYIDTGFVPTDGGHQLSQNDAHFSCWNLTASPPSGTYGFCGNANLVWFRYEPDGKHYFRVNDGGPGITADASMAGHFIASRSVSTGTNLYKDGNYKSGISATSQALSSGVVKIAPDGAVIQIAACSIGSNLNGGSDAANFYSRLATYMTAVGVI